MEVQWQTFRSRPARFVHVDRIVDAFDRLIGDEVALRLREEERFSGRLSAVLVTTYALSDEIGDQPCVSSLRLMLASDAEVEALVRQFGAVYWARAIARQIESEAVVALKQALGDEAYAAAIAHHDLAGPDTNLPQNAELDAAITSAGLRCLAAWCARQPAGVAQRVRLKLADSAELDDPVVPPFDQCGVRIVDRLTA